jgi:hypothetical protein
VILPRQGSPVASTAKLRVCGFILPSFWLAPLWAGWLCGGLSPAACQPSFRRECATPHFGVMVSGLGKESTWTGRPSPHPIPYGGIMPRRPLSIGAYLVPFGSVLGRESFQVIVRSIGNLLVRTHPAPGREGG